MDIQVAHIDLLPTLFSGAKKPLPTDRKKDGVDLLPLVIRDINGSGSRDLEILFWSSGHNRVVSHGDWKLQIADRPIKQ